MSNFTNFISKNLKIILPISIVFVLLLSFGIFQVFSKPNSNSDSKFAQNSSNSSILSENPSTNSLINSSINLNPNSQNSVENSTFSTTNSTYSQKIQNENSQINSDPNLLQSNQVQPLKADTNSEIIVSKYCNLGMKVPKNQGSFLWTQDLSEMPKDAKPSGLGIPGLSYSLGKSETLQSVDFSCSGKMNWQEYLKNQEYSKVLSDYSKENLTNLTKESLANIKEVKKGKSKENSSFAGSSFYILANNGQVYEQTINGNGALPSVVFQFDSLAPNIATTDKTDNFDNSNQNKTAEFVATEGTEFDGKIANYPITMYFTSVGQGKAGQDCTAIDGKYFYRKDGMGTFDPNSEIKWIDLNGTFCSTRTSFGKITLNEYANGIRTGIFESDEINNTNGAFFNKETKNITGSWTNLETGRKMNFELEKK